MLRTSMDFIQCFPTLPNLLAMKFSEFKSFTNSFWLKRHGLRKLEGENSCESGNLLGLGEQTATTNPMREGMGSLM